MVFIQNLGYYFFLIPPKESIRRLHFLSLVQLIVKKGLKKDFITIENNLKKVKGKIDVHRNDRINIMRKRFDRVYCSYQEFSQDTLENRIIKKALLFSQRIVQNPAISTNSSELRQTVNRLLSAFSNVGNNVEIVEVNNIKGHKLYKEYAEAVRLSKLILCRYDYCITNINVSEEKTPPFWIDMSLLYEHYVLGLLRKAYGSSIVYQAKGKKGETPDFCAKYRLPRDVVHQTTKR